MTTGSIQKYRSDGLTDQEIHEPQRQCACPTKGGHVCWLIQGLVPAAIRGQEFDAAPSPLGLMILNKVSAIDSDGFRVAEGGKLA
ncbi:hypothetical protein GGE07_002912 [Sinorhizobium terangae]|nr:hypothetical protein [Sinorhizobium terangae]MBB4186253.1 hypothetical protein [Sinorhizobium terangae]